MPSSQLDDIHLTALKVFLLLDLNGGFLLSKACAWAEADTSPGDLTDVWNEVRFISIVSFRRGLT